MTVLAIKILGFMHALIAVAFLLTGLRVFSLAESERFPRARIIYIGAKSIFASFVLTLCALAAWQRPSLAWVFAFLALGTYLPSPPWARAPAGITPFSSPLLSQFNRLYPFAAAARVLGAFLLALAAFSLDG
jgi:hypothetical protein